MAIIPMQKMRVVAHRSYRADTIDFLQRAGVMEIRELGKHTKEQVKLAEAPSEKEIEELTKELKEAISFLESFKAEKKGFLSGLIGEKRSLSEKGANEILNRFDYRAVLHKTQDTAKRLNDIRAKKQHLLGECANLNFFADLNIKLCDSCGTGLTGIMIGSFSVRDYRGFCPELEAATSLAEIREIRKERSKIYILLIYLKGQEGVIKGLLQKYNFNRFTFGADAGRPSEEIAGKREEIKKLERIEDQFIFGARILIKEVPSLQVTYDLLVQHIKRQEVAQRSGETRSAFVLEGWITKRGYEAFKKNLESEISAAEVDMIEPSEGELPPVAISNPKLFRPFEAVTKLYGLPTYSELDPTLALSAFFIIFFALCLTDAGYGMLLALIAWLMLKKLDLGEGGRKLVQLLFLGGIVTFFIGAMAGGWFGVEVDKMPAALGPLKFIFLKIRMFDPMKNLIGMLIFSLALGVIQVLFGILINFYEKLKAKEYVSAVLDELLWCYFLIALIFMGLSRAMPDLSRFVGLSNNMSLAGAGLLVLTQGRHQKNIFMKIGSGIISLYRTTTYLGNVLSYSRLLALGLTTAGIAMAVNTISGMAYNIPVIGIVVFVFVLILGHTMNLVISALGAFIHSARLQYVEFYQQFFKGGGKAFQPFRVETEYINLK